MTFSLRPDVAADEALSRQRAVVVLAVAGALFLAVLTLRLLVGDAEDAYSMFYVLPVALIATSFGMRAGAGAGVAAIGLIVLWTVVRDVTLTPTGWASRVVPLLLLGVLLGEASDRIRRAEQGRREAAAAALLHREAIEINDSLVQGMAAAKWSLEAGQTEVGLKTLNETIARAHDLVSGLIREAGLGADSRHLPGRD
jgi:hypothetical protein